LRPLLLLLGPLCPLQVRLDCLRQLGLVLKAFGFLPDLLRTQPDRHAAAQSQHQHHRRHPPEQLPELGRPAQLLVPRGRPPRHGAAARHPRHAPCSPAAPASPPRSPPWAPPRTASAAATAGLRPPSAVGRSSACRRAASGTTTPAVAGRRRGPPGPRTAGAT